MKNSKTNAVKSTAGKQDISGTDFLDQLWEESWTYIKTVVDVVRDPILILDKDLRVMAANEPFYHTFRVDAKETENKVVYELGNGQWNIPALRKLLEDILPKNNFFKGFEVTHEFPTIGRKVMILNARQIHFKTSSVAKRFPLIILLVMEDVTEMMVVAEKIAGRTNRFEAELADRTARLEVHIANLERDIYDFKH
ncbi:MAG: PAS domain-containing protein [Candidatus Vogelbacteria bacterium]|nr:PAS domain-containing protein [Candidatus Vogelbacteria bacterium]